MNELFNDTQIAFARYTTPELKKAHWMFRCFAYPSLVKMGNFFFPVAFAIKLPIKNIVKNTVFAHFCGGETLEEAMPVVEKLKQAGVQSILDFSVESSSTEASIVRNLLETQHSIKVASQHAEIPFAVFKPTGFGDPDLLEKASNGSILTDEEQALISRYENRIEQLCKAAYIAGKPILIDAEEVRYQAFIDNLVERMMLLFNKEKCIVFNTLQMYRTDRLAFLETSIAKARKDNYFLGLKFVRGAYMERERARAQKLGVQSPIYPSKEDTDNAFDEAIRIAFSNLDIVTIFCGSHNETSNALLASLIRESGISPCDKRIFFSQLFGMSDHISFNLAKLGFNVVKYIPYGPIKEVMPYLTRRAEENTSVRGQSGRELQRIKKELIRRKVL